MSQLAEIIPDSPPREVVRRSAPREGVDIHHLAPPTG